MAIATLDVIHDIAFTKPGSRKRETLRVVAPASVEIMDAVAGAPVPAATIRYPGGGVVELATWEGWLVSPVRGPGPNPVPALATGSLGAIRDNVGVCLGLRWDKDAWVLHGRSGMIPLSGAPVGRLLSSGFEESLRYVEDVARRLLSVGGVLYERTRPYAWAVHGEPSSERVHLRLSGPVYPRGPAFEHSARGLQLFSLDDLPAAEAYASALAGRTGLPLVRQEASVEVHDGPSLRFPAARISTAMALSNAMAAVAQDQNPLLHKLDDRCVHAFLAVRRAASGEMDLDTARAALREFSLALDAQDQTDWSLHYIGDAAADAGEAAARLDTDAEATRLLRELEEDAPFLSLA